MLTQQLIREVEAIEPQSPIVRDIVSLLQRGMSVPELKEVLDLPRLKDIKADTVKIDAVLQRLGELSERVEIVPDRVVKELSDSELMADIKQRLVEIARRHDEARVSTGVSTSAPTEPLRGIKAIDELSERAKLEYAAHRILQVLAKGMAHKASELASETGFTRQWVYKVLLYKGWRHDSRHSLGAPDPDSLLGQGKITVVSDRVPFRFTLSEPSDGTE